MSRPLGAYGDPLGWPGTALGLPYQNALELLSQRTGLTVWAFTVDQATRSGWCLRDLRARQCVLSGHASNSDERQAALRSVKRGVPGFDWQRVLVCFEDHSTIPLEFKRHKGPGAEKIVMSKKSILSLGATLGRWDELLNIVKHPAQQRIMVPPSEWRRVLRTSANVGTAAWKAQALLWASAEVGYPVKDDNQAEAIAMSVWAGFDGLYLWAQRALASKAKTA
jgi:hypothetical protein